MAFAALRPTFELHMPIACDEVDRRMQQVLKEEYWRHTSLSFERYAELHVPKSEVRYWSPHLSLVLDEDGHGGTRVFGRFAPRQEVWTFVWVLYLALLFIAFFAMIYVYAVSILKQSTWMSVVPILAIAGIASLHFTSRIGQQWSSDQIHKLRTDCDFLFDQVSKASVKLS